MNKIYSLTESEFRDLIANSLSLSDALRKIGISTNGGTSSVKIKKRIKELGCDLSHFTPKGKHRQFRNIPLKDILVKNSSYTSIATLKRRLVSELKWDYICSLCNIGDMWNGVKLVLQLDHINGIKDDHRENNLRFLCPNCHSQTCNYAGKNLKKVSVLATK